MIYADSNVLIHLLEDRTPRGDEVRRRFSRSAGEIAVSPLVELECKVAPVRDGDMMLARRYDRALSELNMLEISPEVYRMALTLRAGFGLKPIDAIHLATAQFHLCDEFWTYDTRLNAAAGRMAVETI